jgi:hypothetical protein
MELADKEFEQVREDSRGGMDGIEVLLLKQ